MVRLSALLFATLAVATPVNRIIPRQANGTSITCGSTTYDEAAINEATEKGCELHEAGETLGNNNYPHKFNNREGLPLETDGPYQEFPILPSGEYDGGKLDRTMPWCGMLMLFGAD